MRREVKPAALWRAAFGRVCLLVLLGAYARAEGSREAAPPSILSDIAVRCPENTEARVDSNGTLLACACRGPTFRLEGENLLTDPCRACPEGTLAEVDAGGAVVACACRGLYFRPEGEDPLSTPCRPCESCEPCPANAQASVNSTGSVVSCNCVSEAFRLPGEDPFTAPCRRCPVNSEAELGSDGSVASCKCMGGAFRLEGDDPLTTPCRVCPSDSEAEFAADGSVAGCKCMPWAFRLEGEDPLTEPCRVCPAGSEAETDADGAVVACACRGMFFRPEGEDPLTAPCHACKDCAACPANSEPRLNSSGSVVQCACSPGTFRLEGEDPLVAPCRACPIGSEAEVDAEGSVVTCGCSTGMFRPEKLDPLVTPCEACPPGSAAVLDQDGQVADCKCSAALFRPGGADPFTAPCRGCWDDSTPEFDAVGTLVACNCTQGSFRIDGEHPVLSPCRRCPAYSQTVMDDDGAVASCDCVAGAFRIEGENPLAAPCRVCPANSEANTDANGTVQACDCVAGAFRLEGEHPLAAPCRVCPARSEVQLNAEGALVACKCMPGAFRLPGEDALLSPCRVCPANTEEELDADGAVVGCKCRPHTFRLEGEDPLSAPCRACPEHSQLEVDEDGTAAACRCQGATFRAEGEDLLTSACRACPENSQPDLDEEGTVVGCTCVAQTFRLEGEDPFASACRACPEYSEPVLDEHGATTTCQCVPGAVQRPGGPDAGCTWCDAARGVFLPVGGDSCECLPGFFRPEGHGDSDCVPCSKGAFCPGRREPMHACASPAVLSAPMSASVEDCVCPAEQHALDASGQCSPCPAGLVPLRRAGARGGGRVCVQPPPDAGSAEPLLFLSAGGKPVEGTEDPAAPGFRFVELVGGHEYTANLASPVVVTDYLVVGGGGEGAPVRPCGSCSCASGGGGGGGEVVFRQNEALVLSGRVRVVVGAGGEASFVQRPDDPDGVYSVLARAGGRGSGGDGASGGGSAGLHCAAGRPSTGHAGAGGSHDAPGGGGGAGSDAVGPTGGWGVRISFGPGERGEGLWYGAGGGGGEHGGGALVDSGANAGPRVDALPGQGGGGGSLPASGERPDGAHGAGGSGVVVLRYARCPTAGHAIGPAGEGCVLSCPAGTERVPKEVFLLAGSNGAGGGRWVRLSAAVRARPPSGARGWVVDPPPVAAAPPRLSLFAAGEPQEFEVAEAVAADVLLVGGGGSGAAGVAGAGSGGAVVCRRRVELQPGTYRVYTGRGALPDPLAAAGAPGRAGEGTTLECITPELCGALRIEAPGGAAGGAVGLLTRGTAHPGETCVLSFGMAEEGLGAGGDAPVRAGANSGAGGAGASSSAGRPGADGVARITFVSEALARSDDGLRRIPTLDECKPTACCAHHPSVRPAPGGLLGRCACECAAGHFAPGIPRGGSVVLREGELCEPCPRTSFRGAGAQVDQCTQCPARTQRVVKGAPGASASDCVCSEGTFGAAGGGVCMDCPARSTGQAVPPSVALSKAETTRADCACPPGHVEAEEALPAGGSRLVCRPCPANTLTAPGAGNQCRQCPAGASTEPYGPGQPLPGPTGGLLAAFSLAGPGKGAEDWAAAGRRRVVPMQQGVRFVAAGREAGRGALGFLRMTRHKPVGTMPEMLVSAPVPVSADGSAQEGFSAAVWVRLPAAGQADISAGEEILADTDTWFFALRRLGTTRRAQVRVLDSEWWSPETAVLLQDGVWRHLCITAERTEGGRVRASLFVNGVLKGTNAPSGSGEWLPGIEVSLRSRANADLMDLRMYARALTGPEAAALAGPLAVCAGGGCASPEGCVLDPAGRGLGDRQAASARRRLLASGEAVAAGFAAEAPEATPGRPLAAYWPQSWNSARQRWEDAHGSGPHLMPLDAAAASGTMEVLGVVAPHPGLGQARVEALWGGRQHRLRVTDALPSGLQAFAVCALARYSGESRGTIVGSDAPGSAFGHDGGAAGVARWGGAVLTASPAPASAGVASDDDWVVYCGTGGGATADGVAHLVNGVGVGVGSAASGDAGRLGINVDEAAPSDWQVAQLLVWDQALSAHEMSAVSQCLLDIVHGGKARLCDGSDGPIHGPDVEFPSSAGVACPEGRYCAGSAATSRACPEGSTTADPGATSRDECVCPKGSTRASAVSGAANASTTPGSFCETCPPMHFCPEPGQPPVPCPENTFTAGGAWLESQCTCAPESFPAGPGRFHTLDEIGLYDPDLDASYPQAEWMTVREHTLPSGYTMQLQNWDHHRAYALGYVNNRVGTKPTARVVGLEPGVEYAWALYSTSTLNAFFGNNLVSVNGGADLSIALSGSRNIALQGTAAAQADGTLLFTFTNLAGGSHHHVHMSGVTVYRLHPAPGTCASCPPNMVIPGVGGADARAALAARPSPDKVVYELGNNVYHNEEHLHAWFRFERLDGLGEDLEWYQEVTGRFSAGVYRLDATAQGVSAAGRRGSYDASADAPQGSGALRVEPRGAQRPHRAYPRRRLAAASAGVCPASGCEAFSSEGAYYTLRASSVSDGAAGGNGTAAAQEGLLSLFDLTCCGGTRWLSQAGRDRSGDSYPYSAGAGGAAPEHAPPPGEWVEIELPVGVLASGFSVALPDGPGLAVAPEGLWLYASHDGGATWDLLFVRSAEIGWALGLLCFQLDPAPVRAYSLFRLHMSPPAGGADGAQVGLASLRVHGTEPTLEDGLALRLGFEADRAADLSGRRLPVAPLRGSLEPLAHFADAPAEVASGSRVYQAAASEGAALQLPHGPGGRSALVPPGTRAFTIALWLRLDTAQPCTILRLDEYLVLGTRGSDQRMIFAVLDSDEQVVGISTPNFFDRFGGAWHHLAVSVDYGTGTVQVFFDGGEDSWMPLGSMHALKDRSGFHAPYPPATDGQGSVWTVFGEAADSALDFVGQAYDLRVYLRRLAAGEVRDLASPRPAAPAQTDLAPLIAERNAQIAAATAFNEARLAEAGGGQRRLLGAGSAPGPVPSVTIAGGRYEGAPGVQETLLHTPQHGASATEHRVRFDAEQTCRVLLVGGGGAGGASGSVGAGGGGAGGVVYLPSVTVPAGQEAVFRVGRGGNRTTCPESLPGGGRQCAVLHLPEGATEARDAAADRALTVGGNPQFAPEAVCLDGDGDYFGDLSKQVLDMYSLQQKDGFSIAVRYKIDASGDADGVIWRLQVAPDKYIFADVWHATGASNVLRVYYLTPASDDFQYERSDVLDGSWHHLVLTWSPANDVKIYLDNQLVSTKSAAVHPVFNSNTVLYIGQNSYDAGYLNGCLDGFRVLPWAASAHEVSVLYHGAKELCRPLPCDHPEFADGVATSFGDYVAQGGGGGGVHTLPGRSGGSGGGGSVGDYGALPGGASTQPEYEGAVVLGSAGGEVTTP